MKWRPIYGLAVIIILAGLAGLVGCSKVPLKGDGDAADSVPVSDVQDAPTFAGPVDEGGGGTVLAGTDTTQREPRPSAQPVAVEKPWVQMATSRNCEACVNMRYWLDYYAPRLPFQLHYWDVDEKGWPAGVDSLPAFAWKRSDGVTSMTTNSVQALVTRFNETYSR